jgi:hypothetical protein
MLLEIVNKKKSTVWSSESHSSYSSGCIITVFARIYTGIIFTNVYASFHTDILNEMQVDVW